MPSHEPYTEQALPVISDIHGNLAGLRAVLALLGERGIARAPLFLGDYIWTHQEDADPEDMVEILDIVANGPSTGIVGGNTDEYLVNGWLDSWAPQDAEERRTRDRMRALRARLSRAQLQFLMGLPQSFAFELAGLRCLACHASPLGNAIGLPLDLEAGEAAVRMAGAAPDCLVTGHLHRAFTRRMPGGTLQIATGAIGRHPHECDGIVDFTILDATPLGLVAVHHRIAQPTQSLSARPHRA